MRILGVGETCDLGALYLALQAEGHAVRVAVSEPLAAGTLKGLVPRTSDWRAELDWVRAAGPEGIVVFESVSEGYGALQDALRRDGLNVVGGSAYGDRLETDRAYAQSVLRELGLPTAPTRAFAGSGDALAFLRAHPGRYVVKAGGADHDAADTYVGLLPDGRDVAALLAARAAEPAASARPLVLMDAVEGVEMGVGAYFDGEAFLRPACLDFEHKRFFPGDIGELTGEMGTVATFDGAGRVFARTLAPMAPRLRAGGVRGWVNLNTIVNAEGIWPLEFTCRFGYPGFAVLTPLQATPWGELLQRIAGGGGGRLETRPGFSVGVVITTPPFPYSRHEVDEPVGLPITFGPAADPACHHLGEVGRGDDGGLVTAGLYGWTLVVTGTGSTIADAQRAAYRQVGEVAIPQARWRGDIGERLRTRDWAEVERLGLLGD